MDKDLKSLADYLDEIPISEREKKIMEFRHGIRDVNNFTHTLEETGKLFGVTRERIRQIEWKVFEKIRQHKET